MEARLNLMGFSLAMKISKWAVNIQDIWNFLVRIIFKECSPCKWMRNVPHRKMRHNLSISVICHTPWRPSASLNHCGVNHGPWYAKPDREHFLESKTLINYTVINCLMRESVGAKCPPFGQVAGKSCAIFSPIDGAGKDSLSGEWTLMLLGVPWMEIRVGDKRRSRPNGNGTTCCTHRDFWWLFDCFMVSLQCDFM